MKPQDFRIGNYLIENKYNMIVNVTDLTDDKIGVTGDFKGRWQVEPIPLTEEWLLKFGFHKDIYGLFLKDVFEITNHNQDDFVTGKYTVRIAKGIYIKIKHVHQLQNLYFALTGEELILKQ